VSGFGGVHGYKHRYHPLEVGAGIERVEAAHLILEVFRKAQVPWDRKINPLRGWEGSRG